MSETECGYCKKRPAIGIKREQEYGVWSNEDGGKEVSTFTDRPICGKCNDYLFDGTEAHPELKPLKASDGIWQ